MSESGEYVGRGGLKLEAALKLLGGGERIQNARAVDIGASTGGFTECLLRHGAKQVTAIEVGHDQLHEKLRNDARVVNLERTNFKTVSLKVAPGPFDYFVIDVSFVAARTMLRPLAFRLRPGAEGVILVKPQFELPDAFVHEGQVKSEKLRSWALQRVRKKGIELGFRLLKQADSPVQLESGTVELLTRWRYDGPTAKLKGEDKKPAHVPSTSPSQKPKFQAPKGKPHHASTSAPMPEKKPAPALPFETPALPPRPQKPAKRPWKPKKR
ncbi:MAG: 16S/23S rRNA (cytidine-2'-O)-methyltransferase [Deltaproteobacteria bacterium]|nr:16S/23S rRNA (cytidine-2'-O)-methyltransferase [Deltaproteobacteria bacterium]